MEVSRIIRMIFFVVCTAIAAACTRYPFISVSNNCMGAWMRITDGDNRHYSSNLMPGERISTVYQRPPDGYSSNVVLNADGFRIRDSTFVGSASRTFTLTGRSSILGPNQNVWNVKSLSPDGCPQK